MTPEPLILEALSYFRYTGADPGTIRSFLRFREDRPYTPEEDRQTLQALQASGRAVKVGKRWLLCGEALRQARGPSLAPSWQAEDGWILLAALYWEASAPVPLRELLATADFIEHAVPGWAELHGALNRLESGGLVRLKRGSFETTEKARELFVKVEATCPKVVLSQLDGLRRLLDCPCCGVRLKSVRWKVPLPKDEYEAAVAAYQAAASQRAT